MEIFTNYWHVLFNGDMFTYQFGLGVMFLCLFDVLYKGGEINLGDIVVNIICTIIYYLIANFYDTYQFNEAVRFCLEPAHSSAGYAMHGLQCQLTTPAGNLVNYK